MVHLGGRVVSMHGSKLPWNPSSSSVVYMVIIGIFHPMKTKWLAFEMFQRFWGLVGIEVEVSWSYRPLFFYNVPKPVIMHG
jgi:hypothetical protein